MKPVITTNQKTIIDKQEIERIPCTTLKKAIKQWEKGAREKERNRKEDENKQKIISGLNAPIKTYWDSMDKKNNTNLYAAYRESLKN